MNEYIPVTHSEVGARYTGITTVENQLEELHNPVETYLAIGKARVNGLRHAIRTEDTEYGRQYDKQLEDPRSDHHNRFHQRHVDKFAGPGLQAFIAHYDISYSPLDTEIFKTEEALTDIAAFSMFPALHDNTQLDYVAHNLEIIDKSQKLHEKKAHGVGAAIQTLVFTQKYAEVNGLNMDEAWSTTTAAATMMLRHDEPKLFDKTFAKDKKYSGAEVRGLAGKDLLEAYEKDEIRVYDLSPAQIIDIFKQSRGAQEGYGFVESFEQDYAQELEMLATYDEPIMGDISPEREERLRHLTEIAYWADMADMISPYTEQLTRTLNTQYSRKRPFSIFNSENGEDIYIDEAMSHIQGENGTLNSDDVRLLWEMLHVNGISHDSLYKDVPMVKDFLKEHVLMGGLVLREMGAQVMRGDYSVVENIYNHRLTELNKRVFALEERLREEGNEDKINGAISRKVQGIIDERDGLIESLQEKHVSYSPEDAQKFQQLVDRVLGQLCTMYDVTEDDLFDYQAKVDEFIKADTLMFESDPVVQNPLKITQEAARYFTQKNLASQQAHL